MKALTTKQYVELIDVMARMKMKAQANKLLLSYLWWILEPLLFVGMFYLVFQVILNRGGEDYFTFLVVGKVMFIWFSKGVVAGSKGLIENRGIIALRPLPKWIFPIVNVQEVTYRSIVSFVMMLLIIAITSGIKWEAIYQIIPLLFVQYVLIISISMFTSIFVGLAEDFSQIIALGMMGLMFSSGVFWDINKINNEKIRDAIIQFNPLASLIDNYRTVIIDGGFLSYDNYYSIIITTVSCLMISVVTYHKMNKKITRSLFS